MHAFSGRNSIAADDCSWHFTVLNHVLDAARLAPTNNATRGHACRSGLIDVVMISNLLIT
jgi:hypothetical protein